MSYPLFAFSQHLATQELPTAVRAVIGKLLRRATPLTQLALTGALSCLPAERRALPTALLWQSTHGPLLETARLLTEVCHGAGEPMPYDFLATQPAIAAAQIQPFLPGLQSATHFPLAEEGQANWSLLLTLGARWLNAGRYQQVLCAHLDSEGEQHEGHWLVLTRAPLEIAAIRLHLAASGNTANLPDTPDLPRQLADWLSGSSTSAIHLESPAQPALAVEFARI